MKKLILASLLFVVPFPSLAQQAKLDSLVRLNAEYLQQDNTKLNILNSLAQEYEWWQIDSGVVCANQAITLAHKLNNQKQLATAYYNKVRLFYYQGKYAEREQILKTALAISTKLDDKNAFGEYYYNYAFVKVNQERRQLIQKALEIFTQVNNNEGIARTSLALTGSTSDTVTAMEYLNTAFKVFSQQKNLPQTAHTLQSMRGKTNDIHKKEELQQRALTISQDKITLTGYHYGLAIRYLNLSKPDYPKSLEQWLIAAKISEQHGNITALTGALGNIGEIFRYLNRNDDALKYLEKASMIAEKTGHIGQQMFMCRTKGVIYTKIARYPEAIKELNKYLKLNEVQKSDNDEFLAYYYLASTYQKSQDYEKSLNCLKKAEELNKKTNEEDNRENLGGMLIIKGLVIKNAPDSLLLKEGLQPAQRNSIVINTIKEGLKFFPTDQDGMLALYEMYRLQHDDKNALKYHLLYVAAKDSIASLDNSKAMTNLQIDFEVGKKEAQISLLNKDKEIQEKELDKQKVVRNAFIGGFGIMLLFAGLFLFQRNRISKEKNRSDNLLLNILPAEVAEELKEKGSADAKHFDNVTVLFTDFKSFTKVSEQLSPQELVNELHTCFKSFDEIITKYNIEKIKTIGDAYLAVCGLPLADEKHAVNVVNAALEIREFMEKRRQNLGEKTFEVRIGINSGSVVAGIVGVKKFAYDIWGDTVNTAARMEQNSEAGKINISETTYALVKDKVTCDYRGEIDAKNKGKLKMYFVGTNFMKTLLLIVSVLFVTTNSYAQDQRTIDSLETVLSSAKQDTAKALVLAQLSKAYIGKNPDKALAFAQQCLALSEQLGYKRGIASGYYWSAYFSTRKKTVEIVLEMHFKALRIREEIGEKKGIASSCFSIGNIYMEQGNYSEALAYYFKGLKICEEIKEKPLAINLFENISSVYLVQGKYSEALSYSKAGAKVAEEVGNLPWMAQLYNNMGESHRHLGNYPEALKVYFAALSIHDRKANNKTKSKANCLNNIGEVYNQLGNYLDAQKYNLSALAIAEEIKDETGISVSYINLGSISIKTKKYSEASTYLTKGLSYANNLSNFNNIYRMELMKDSYNYLAKLDSATGNITSAYKNYKLYITYRDSLLYGENAKKSTQLLMQFEFDKKEAVSKVEQAKRDAVAEQELQKQKLMRNGFIGGFSIMLLFAGLFLFQRNRIKKGKKLSDNLLLNILPAEVAEELKEKGSADAKHFDNVTVLFTDFKSFTKVSEQLSPQELVNELHTCFKSFDEIITKYNIEKIKTIGDAYLAVCGLPLADEKHAVNVVNAALEIREFMEKRRQNLGEKTFEIRIGINSGSVVAGIVGVKKFAYDIWGDTVNTAARMEQNSEAGKINISETTYELVKEKFTCEYRGEINAKNKGKLKMYFIRTTA